MDMEIKRYDYAGDYGMDEQDKGEFMRVSDVLRVLDEFNERINKARQMAPEMRKIAIAEKDKIISRMTQDLADRDDKIRSLEWQIQTREQTIRDLERDRNVLREEKVKEKLKRAGQKVCEAVRRAEDAEFNAKTARDEVERLRVISIRQESVLRGIRNMVMGELGV